MIKKHHDQGLPEFFNSYETGKPFIHCLMCNSELQTKDKYIIEKVFKQNKNIGNAEIIHEYAICMDCATDVQSEISEESIQSMQKLFEDYSFNALMKLEYLHSTEKYNIESWIERCSFTGKEIRMCSEYAVSGIIENNQLVYEHSPIVVSDEFMELMQESLSKKTRDYLDGFRDEFFDLPPELKDLINGPTVGIF